MPKIGLALEGGGLKGSYQIGSYYAFLKCHIKIDGVVGTSIGSFNASMIAANQAEDLMCLWRNLEPEKVLDINQNFADFVNGKQGRIEGLKGLSLTLYKIIKEHGLSSDKLREFAANSLNLESLYKSKMDFGLVTVRLKDLKPVYLYKEDIEPSKMINYIFSSCSLPIFQLKPLVDDTIYLDGGFYDNCPTSMLIKKNYQKIYEIRINGIGRNQKIETKNTEIITISPSRNVCSVVEMNHSRIEENILLGYYDTLRVLKKHDGKYYNFKKTPKFLINLCIRKISSSELKRLNNFFRTKDNKELVIKAVEYCLQHEDVFYYKVYNLFERIHYIKKYTTNKNFVYTFVKKLRIL